MTNANPLIDLRNKATLWIVCAIGCFIGSWWLYHFLSDAGTQVLANIEVSQGKITLVQNEGVDTDADWETLESTVRDETRWATMSALVPSLNKLVGIGTPAAAGNIETMKVISQKTNADLYIPWLESSWTAEAQDALEKTQLAIAEIIPLFAGISELSATKDIHGKITLASLIEYIQTVIVEKFGLGNLVGGVGIERVEFLKESPEIGIYEVPLEFKSIPNQNIIKLLGFLRKTGAVVVSENINILTLEHRDPLSLESEKPTISSLKNLLITVKSLSITPTKKEGDMKKTTPESLTIKENSLWDISLVLQFYIRGVSRDHIALLDTRIDTLLSRENIPESLITQSNTLIRNCKKCPQAAEIRDISTLLTNARAAYDSIIKNEKTAKEEPNPLEVIERRTALITTLETLKRKLEVIANLTSNPLQ